MAELTFEDYKQRLNIQQLLVDAGYTRNRRDGLLYPSYVRYGDDGRRVRGDKFIVTANGFCCFQPPERKNYNVISFITDHPELFSDYTPGMDKYKLVHLVCGRLLNQPVEERQTYTAQPEREKKLFTISDYIVDRFDVQDWESQKRFYPYFKGRGITNATQKVFAARFFLASQERSGKTYTNLSFPMVNPKFPNDYVGLEERGMPNATGQSYKGMARDTDAQNGVWMAKLKDGGLDINAPLKHIDDVYWFESAYDAMSYYQLHRQQLSGTNSVFISTGGTPSAQQIRGVLNEIERGRGVWFDLYKPFGAKHHLCFDRDRADQMFAMNLAMQSEGRTFTSHVTTQGQLVVTDMTNKFERHVLDLAADGDRDTEAHFAKMCEALGLSGKGLCYEPAAYPYKDWNDQLLQKPMKQEQEEYKGYHR